MAQPGRPTTDPKRGFIGLRLAERDVEALKALAKERGITVSEAARQLIGEALRNLSPKRHRAQTSFGGGWK